MQFKRFRCSRKLTENGGPDGIKEASKSMPWASKVTFVEIWGVSNIFLFVMTFGSAKSWPPNAKISDFGRQSDKQLLSVVGVGGRGGVLGRRKRRGY